MLDKAFALRSLLIETEESTLYYISGYFAFKENIAAIELVDAMKAVQAQNVLIYYPVANFHVYLLKFLNYNALFIIITKMSINLVLIICYKHFMRSMNSPSFRI